ncbi:hypothetical protein Salat_2023500 [Sesamum alatum]|uniref:Chlororespiratory reduction 41 n=1 Tax=Sesamum alatum TaxID=300844 RepID=A0AAE1XZ74_9LAMI|nr:hypothetical protein Salat_2023500 [Sesamum alatum]
MASNILQFLPFPHPSHQTIIPSQNQNPPLQFLHPISRPNHFTPKCTSNSNPQPEFPNPGLETTVSADKFPIEKRRKSEIIRDRKSRTGLVKPEPPNFEVGWKRTKPHSLEKPTEAGGVDGEGVWVGCAVGNSGEIVAERARERRRVLKLMEMDLAMVKGAVKEETLNERLEQAKARCRQAILVANSF